jgi:hypothetical protein
MVFYQQIERDGSPWVEGAAGFAAVQKSMDK